MSLILSLLPVLTMMPWLTLSLLPALTMVAVSH